MRIHFSACGRAVCLSVLVLRPSRVCPPFPALQRRYNAGSQALLKYLLLGASGDELGEPTINYADQPLEDLAFVISEDGVAVYHPTGLPGEVDAHLDMWRNVTLHTVLPQDMEQREEVELFKIKAFIDMVKDAAYVGAPLTGGWSRDGVVKDATTFDQFEIEGWPLVQAYGIADFGTGGFFTMNHRVMNVTPLLQSLYAHVDAHFVKVSATINRAAQALGRDSRTGVCSPCAAACA